MTSYQAPIEDLREFNNAVFKEANSTTLTLSKANSLYLGRTGVASSTASSTTFSGSIVTSDNLSVNGLTVGQSSVATGNTLLGVSAGAAINNVLGTNNTLIGYGAGPLITGGFGNTFVGQGAGSVCLGGNKNGRSSRKSGKFRRGSTEPRPFAYERIRARGESRRRKEEKEEFNRQVRRMSQSISRKTPAAVPNHRNPGMWGP
jgi:hypothetical protein